MGDLLFSIAQLSRRLGIEPETALRKADDKFTKRFDRLEQSVTTSGRTMKDMTLEELEAEWQRLKDATQTDSTYRNHEDTKNTKTHEEDRLHNDFPLQPSFKTATLKFISRPLAYAIRACSSIAARDEPMQDAPRT